MANLSEIMRGIRQFGRTENLQNGPVHPVRELAWLSRRAVQEDRAVDGVDHREVAKLYWQRLIEIGFIFTEVFVRKEYPWTPQSETPKIIDLGGDIGGFSVLYWKSLAPKANVTLVEANPSTTAVVSESLKRKGLEDVKVINAAASEREGETTLYLHKPGAWFHPSDFVGGRENMDSSLYYPVTIPAIKVSTLVGNERVDLLKMDIEGAEGGVLRELESSGKLELVDEIIMEFHNNPNNPTNSLQEVLQILRKGDFTIENGHKSGRRKRRRTELVDVDSVKPSDKMVFMITAKRNNS